MGKQKNFTIKPPPSPEKIQKMAVSDRLEENESVLDERLHRNESYDIKRRSFKLQLGRKKVRASLYFIDGMVKSSSVDEYILMPLMLASEKLKERGFDAIGEVLLPHDQMRFSESFDEATEAICYGSCVLLIDGCDQLLLLQVIGWDKRGVEEPKNEPAVFGPQQAFTESLKTNTSLIRKMIRSEHLIIDSRLIGNCAKTSCAVLYMKNITNPSLVREVKRRIQKIAVDYILSSCELAQFIEEKSRISLPQILLTERPDRCARAVLTGRVVVLVDNSPMALILPTTVFELLESAEDVYLRPIHAFLVKSVRLLGVFLSIYLPGLYIAVITYHTTILPTGMLTTIMKASRKIPFSSITELIIMVIAFEIVREASARVPGFLGSSLGIIGPLVLGQAAIGADIVSPVMIIVFSIATIGSFATPNFSMAFSGRVLEILYIVLGSVGGLLGIAAGIFVQSVLWSTTGSFGVPMLSPIVPKSNELPDTFSSAPLWKKEKRPSFLKPIRKNSQRHISREWLRRG